MDRRSLAILSITGLLLLPGCHAQQLASDQNQFRQVLTSMYEDQIMDNLIRAKNRMPMLQLDYTNITGTVSDSGVASFGATPGTTTTTTFAPVVATRSLVRAIARPFSYGLSETRLSQLTVTANPIVDNSSVYLAYLSFVERPGRLIQSCDPPPPEAAHIMRKSGNMFYWVPVEYRAEFLEMSLRTTGVRSDPASAPEFFAVLVTGYSKIIEEPSIPGTPRSFSIRLQIDKPIPNDKGGYLDATIHGRSCRFRLTYTTPEPTAKPAKPKDAKGDQKTDDKDTQELTIDYFFDPDKEPGPVEKTKVYSAPFPPAVVARALAGQLVKVQLDNFKPPIPTVTNLLDSINNNTQLLRLNQLQLMNK